MSQGMGKGFDFPMGEGDIDWQRVREELAKIGFSSWATAEVRGGDRQRGGNLRRGQQDLAL